MNQEIRPGNQEQYSIQVLSSLNSSSSSFEDAHQKFLKLQQDQDEILRQQSQFDETVHILNNEQAETRKSLQRERDKLSEPPQVSTVDPKDKAHEEKKEERGEVSSPKIKSKNNFKNLLETLNASKGVRPRKTRLLIDALYMNRILNSDYLIKVDNNLNFIGPRLTYRKNITDSGSDATTSIMYLKPLEINDIQYKLPAVINGNFQYLSSIDWLPVDLLFGAHYENIYLITLPELNKGFKAINNHILWAQFGMERVFSTNRFGLFIIQAYMAKNFYAQSRLLGSKPIMMDASRYDFGIEYEIFSLNLSSHVAYDTITSSTLSKLKINQTSTYFSITYTF